MTAGSELRRKRSLAFAFAFATAMTCAWVFFLPPDSSLATLLGNVYAVVNFVGLKLAMLLQMLIGPHLGIFVGPMGEGTSLIGTSAFVGEESSWIVEHVRVFLAATTFLGAFMQGLVYAVVGSWVLHWWRRRQSAEPTET